MKKRLCYGAILLVSFGTALLFGVLLWNTVENQSVGAWDVHFGRLISSFFLTLIPLSFLLETLWDREEFVRDVRAFGRYKHLLWNLVERDIKTKYRRSALGLLWSVLNPLLMMAVLSTVFSVVLRVEITAPGGYALFYLVGYLLFNFVSESTALSLTSVLGASALVKKVYVPKYIFPLEKCLCSLVNLLFSMVAFVIVFVVFALMGRVAPHPAMLLFPLPILYAFVFSFGLSLLLASLNIFFRDVAHLYGVFLTVWMYATPILYPMENTPGVLRLLVDLNPLTHYVNYFRDVLLYGRIPSPRENLVCILFALLFLLLGVTVFRKNQQKFVLHM